MAGCDGHNQLAVIHSERGTTCLEDLLQACASLHHHLCPRQVLGVRMGLLAGHWLDVPVPESDKRLLAITETDGCAADGVAVATGCWVGRRTMQVLDFGKVAVTVVDTHTRRAVRVAPRCGSRQLVACYAPQATSRWEAYLIGYQRMPDYELLKAEEVTLRVPLERLVSREGHRVRCAACGEEVFNEREVMMGGSTLCRSCAGECYYRRMVRPEGLMLVIPT